MAQPVTQWVSDILRSATHPLTIAEVEEQIRTRQPSSAPTPKSALRSALSANRLIASLGGRPARYSWWPHDLNGNWFRQPLRQIDWATGQLPISEEVWCTLWPEFYAPPRQLVYFSLELAGGPTVETRVKHLQPRAPLWGLAGSQELFGWLHTLGAVAEDDLLIHVVDISQRRYQVSLDRATERDALAIGERDRQMLDHVFDLLRGGSRQLRLRSHLVPRLVARGAYGASPPPSPLAGLLRSDLRFVVHPVTGVDLTERLVAQEESEWPDYADPLATPRPRGDRHAPASAAKRMAWGEYLFDWGMEYRWGGDDLMAEACYRAALQVDPGHADAWVHVGNLRLDEGLLEEALSHYLRGEDAALERTIGNPRTYKSVFWGDIKSRPYMRALHGKGLSLWRLGRPAEARKVFRQMLRLNPNDNQGARFLVRDLDEGLSWEESVARDEAERQRPS